MFCIPTYGRGKRLNHYRVSCVQLVSFPSYTTPAAWLARSLVVGGGWQIIHVRARFFLEAKAMLSIGALCIVKPGTTVFIAPMLQKESIGKSYRLCIVRICYLEMPCKLRLDEPTLTKLRIDGHRFSR